MPIRGESLRELVYLRRRLNQMFDEMLQPDKAPQALPDYTWTPAADVYEDEVFYFAEVELPGVTIGDVEVTAESNLLRIAGEQEFRSFDLLAFHNTTAADAARRPRIRILYSIPQN